MAKKRAQKSANTNANASGTIPESPSSLLSLPAAELFSFLKEIRAAQTWTEKDLSNTLNINAAQATDALAVLELQGYIEPVGGSGKWRVTEEGELVSGAKSPRFTRESMDEALAASESASRPSMKIEMPLTPLPQLSLWGISFATNRVYRPRMLAFGFSRRQMHNQ